MNIKNFGLIFSFCRLIDAYGMVNKEDPYQTAPSGAV